jgi:hypothetical protein
VKYEGPIYGVGRNFNGRKIYFDTGRTSQEWDAMETKIVNLERENAALLRDKERLDSRTIRIIHRDDLGNPSPCIHSGIDLRAAIDAARKEGAAP